MLPPEAIVMSRPVLPPGTMSGSMTAAAGSWDIVCGPCYPPKVMKTSLVLLLPGAMLMPEGCIELALTCPSPAAALGRVGPASYLGNTIELVLVV